MSNKVYERFSIDFFEDGDAMGIKDFAHIDPDTPLPIQKALKKIFNCLHKNYPMLIIAESDEMKGNKQ